MSEVKPISESTEYNMSSRYIYTGEQSNQLYDLRVDPLEDRYTELHPVQLEVGGEQAVTALRKIIKNGINNRGTVLDDVDQLRSSKLWNKLINPEDTDDISEEINDDPILLEYLAKREFKVRNRQEALIALYPDIAAFFRS